MTTSSGSPRVNQEVKMKGIGCFLGTLTSPYHNSILNGASDHALSRGYSFYGYSGQRIGTPDPSQSIKAEIFKFVNPSLMQGILFPVTLAQYMSREELARFFDEFKGVEKVTISGDMKDYSNVVADNKAGMMSMARHLVEEHSFENYVLIRAIETNIVSNLREEGLLEVFRDKGIDPEAHLTIFHEKIEELSGRIVAHRIVEEKVPCDCIVCVNDGIALECMKTLKDMGISVPEDIAVVSYQGRFESLFSSPPLTTVDEDPYLQGELAAKELIDRIERGGGEVRDIFVPATLEIRNSCGCKGRYVPRDRETFHEERGFYTLSEMRTRALEEAMQIDREGTQEKLNENALDELDMIYKVESWMLVDRMIELFRRIGYFRIDNTDLKMAVDYLNQYIFLKHCYIVTFDREEPPFNRGTIEIAFHDGQFEELDKEEKDIDPAVLIPEKLLSHKEPCSYIIEMLVWNGAALGYIIFDRSMRALKIFEAIKNIISASLQTRNNVQSLKMANERFHDIAISTSDWIWEVDEDLNFTYCSGEAKTVIGYSTEELMGKSLFSFLRDDEKEYKSILIEHFINKRKAFENKENWNLNRFNQPVALTISGRPIYNGEGKFRGYRGAFKDITQKKLSEEKIAHMAYFDQLTGLPNRALFMERLNHTIRDSGRVGNYAAVLFLDLDRFKNLNDTLGHAYGDELLLQVGVRIQDQIRESDTVARIGGDEFAVLLTNLSGQGGVSRVARNIVSALSENYLINGQSFYFTASIGISLFPEDGSTSDILLKKADTAMYEAKDEGKNRFFFYQANMDVRSKERLKLETLMHDALEQKEFVLYYQPIVRADSQELVFFEALLRWKNPDAGWISPETFISIAEENGQIEKIGMYVFEESVRQIREWKDKFGFNLKISINFSAKQLSDKKIIPKLKAILEKYAVSGEDIHIEITESIILKNEDYIIATLNELREQGFSIFLDDFGTGYSSMSYLQRLPIDAVKIDKSFVMNMIEQKQSRILAKTILDMSRNLEYSVIAEGVETEEAVEMLKNWGCDYLQGFLFSRPIPVAEVEKRYFN
ncbi:MAG: EAL domain-containing protein [Spirochaetales bacterium]|nr:EAL domain-containing protein [Spirochaetales bacterium]